MKKRISKILALVMAIAMLAGIVSAVSAEPFYESPGTLTPNGGVVDPNVVVGSRFIMEAVINIPDIPAENGGSHYGMKFVLSNTAAGSNVEFWICRNSIRVHDSAWSTFKDFAFDFSSYLNQDTKFKLVVDNNYYALYINDTAIWGVVDDKLQLTAESKLTFGNWDAPYTVKSLKVDKISAVGTVAETGNPGDEGGSDDPNVLFELSAPSSGPVDPGVVTGSHFSAEAVINISEFTNEWGNLKLLVGKNADGSDIQMEFSKTGFWAAVNTDGNTEYVGADYEKFAAGSKLNQDIALKLVVEGSKWTLFVDGAEIWTHTSDALLPTDTSAFKTGAWEVTHSIKSLKITKIEAEGGGEEGDKDPNLLFELSAPAANGVAPNVVVGSRYTVETTLNITSMSDIGIKFILGTNTAGKQNELWLAGTSNDIFISNPDWKGSGLAETKFNFNELKGKDIALKLVVDGTTVSVSIDGEEAWKWTDPSFQLEETSVFELNQWTAEFTVKTLKIISNKSASDGPNEPDKPSDPNVLYEWSGDYQGMNPGEGQEAVNFVVDKSCGADYVLETVINVSSIGTGDGRGVKLILRDNAQSSSGNMELWIGADHIWACTNEWKGHTAFDFRPYMNQDVTVKAKVKGDTVTLYLNGVQVWTCTDSTFAQSTAGTIELGGWDAKYVVKSVKVTNIDTLPDTGDGFSTLICSVMALSAVGGAVLLTQKKRIF